MPSKKIGSDAGFMKDVAVGNLEQTVDDVVGQMTRRHFFGQNATGLGIAALGSLLASDGYAAPISNATNSDPLAGGLTHLAPKAKRVIYLF